MLLLKPSGIHGVGVFTSRAIKRGSRIDLFENEDWRFVERPQGEAKHLCERFGIRDAGGYHCPKSWLRMSIGWYLNHSSDPNLTRYDGDIFRAARYIRANEELTIDYTTLEG